MMTCEPTSLFSWNFDVAMDSGEKAGVAFRFLTEEGAIHLNGIEYTIRKQGWLSGEWALEGGGETWAIARKPSAFYRTFEIQAREMESLTLEARSALTRCFDIVSANRVIGTIEPANGFVRRTYVECEGQVPALIQLFCFWLAVMTWRRQKNSS